MARNWWQYPNPIKCYMAGSGGKYFPCIEKSDSRFKMKRVKIWCYGYADKMRKCSSSYPKKGKTHRVHQVWEYMCRYHALEANEGIVTYRCSKKCLRQAQKETDIKLEEEDVYTYFSLDAQLAIKEGTWDSKKHIPAFKVHCWHCGREFK